MDDYKIFKALLWGVIFASINPIGIITNLANLEPLYFFFLLPCVIIGSAFLWFPILLLSLIFIVEKSKFHAKKWVISCLFIGITLSLYYPVKLMLNLISQSRYLGIFDVPFFIGTSLVGIPFLFASVIVFKKSVII